MSLGPAAEAAIREHDELERKRFSCEPIPAHECIRSGWTCLVDHGNVMQCEMCKVCGQWIEGEEKEIKQ